MMETLTYSENVHKSEAAWKSAESTYLRYVKLCCDVLVRQYSMQQSEYVLGVV